MPQHDESLVRLFGRVHLRKSRMPGASRAAPSTKRAGGAASFLASKTSGSFENVKTIPVTRVFVSWVCRLHRAYQHLVLDPTHLTLSLSLDVLFCSTDEHGPSQHVRAKGLSDASRLQDRRGRAGHIRQDEGGTRMTLCARASLQQLMLRHPEHERFQEAMSQNMRALSESKWIDDR